MFAGNLGWYSIQAAIAAEHARAPSAEGTNWKRIVEHYDRLIALDPSPVVALNRAVAISMVDGPASALGIVDRILKNGELSSYAYIHAARADFYRQLGLLSEAKASYETALSFARQNPERKFLSMQIARLGD